MRATISIAVFVLLQHAAIAQIERATDAPLPLSPQDSAESITIPDGFELQLLAAEPLVREPSGVCWDEHGRLFVSELHGYNLEGHYDIEELNKTGELDRVVRRIFADEATLARAEKEAHGTVKLLLDSDGDGLMDEARIWADDLPPCLGVCPGNGGIIAVCAPDIVFLADRDGDGDVDVRETLFTGFETGVIERRINAPKWGPDNWIYVGRGRGGHITGPHLREAIDLPSTDFRIKPDGSAIEPVTGGTHTFGFAFDEAGDRYVISTGAPAIFVAPIPWRYLTRNPNMETPSLTAGIAPSNRTYPTSQPHPWRTRRAEDPGFSKYYTDRYGAAESTPNGFFTSACSPLVYQDRAIPGLHGQLLACEPAQNMIHRAILSRDGLVPALQRAPGEEEAEFLASSDTWFHPMALSHAPDGSVAVVDFYREIIEDYSAIPRYLQQQYGLLNGKDHGRVWVLTHRDMPQSSPANMAALTSAELSQEIASSNFWRRQTSRRLLLERSEWPDSDVLRQHVADDKSTAAVINALYTLDGTQQLRKPDVQTALKSQFDAVRVHALRLSESFLNSDEDLQRTLMAMHADPSDTVILQLVLTAGEIDGGIGTVILAELATTRGDVSWLSTAVLSSAGHREVDLLVALAHNPREPESPLFPPVLRPLCTSIAHSRSAGTISAALSMLREAPNDAFRGTALNGLVAGFSEPERVAVSDAAVEQLAKLGQHDNSDIREAARQLRVLLKAETEAERAARIDRAMQLFTDVTVGSEKQLLAIEELASENTPELTRFLLSGFAECTPRSRTVIMEAVFSRKERLADIIAAMEDGRVPASALSALQREQLRTLDDMELGKRAASLMQVHTAVDAELLARYTAALNHERDLENGAAVFKAKCAACHRTHGVGHTVGPDLTAEFRRPEATFVRDILAPNAEISAGYTTYIVQTKSGRSHSGLLAVEAPGSITLRAAEGKTQTVLRRNIEELRGTTVSLMPEDLVKTVSPQDVADALAWIRQPSDARILFDEDPGFASLLIDGGGSATIVSDDVHHGLIALRVTPLQRHAVRIPGWEFRIREDPAPGEFRYIRFAWKTVGGDGALIELASNGSWPPADSSSFRYFAGRNTSNWQATEVNTEVPAEWTVVTRDLWADFGDATITGIAPTALGGPMMIDAIELLRADPSPPQ